jgi:CBS domain-containing membrane protein
MFKTVEDIMTQRVIFVHEEDSMETIRDGMEAYGLRHIPVVEGGKVVGLLSHRDLLRLSDHQFRTSSLSQAIDDKRMNETFVADVMTRDVRTAPPDMPLADAAEILLKHKFGCLPVTNADGTLIGIVTEHDFLKAMVEMLRSAG